MMTNRRNGTLDTGVTDNLARRAWEHRAGLVAGFTKKHGLKMFVYVEEHDGMLAARQREQNIKHWPRAWKVRLIHGQDPDWEDRFDRLPQVVDGRHKAGHEREMHRIHNMNYLGSSRIFPLTSARNCCRLVDRGVAFSRSMRMGAFGRRFGGNSYRSRVEGRGGSKEKNHGV